MKKLAIKGHPTRGKEVIELLKMMGGVNINVTGEDDNGVYLISTEGTIEIHYTYYTRPDNYAIFTLEEFLEKFPYKVGDKVIHNIGILMNVVHMYWDTEDNVVLYDIQSPVDNNYKLIAMLAEDLQPYIWIGDFVAAVKTDLFSEVTFENSPIEVELVIKK